MNVYERIQHMSEHDTLTGLHNRNKMFTNTKQMLDEHKEQDFVFLRVDIERFALFNTSFGEVEGDRLLCYFAKSIEEYMKAKPIGTYGRITADVFCMCFPYDNEEEQLRMCVKELQERLEQYREDYVLTCSMGVYEIEDRSVSMEDAYIKASMAVASCKNQYGKNVGFYDRSFGRRAEEEVQIVKEMKTALDEKQFVIYLQPKISLSNDLPCGAEALVRWEHPEKGLIPPGQFIPVFESNGFIAQLDFYVWEQTCQIIRRWLDEGQEVQPISVNISRISLYNPQLVDLLVNLIKKYNFHSSLLQLEITESAYMTSSDLMEETIKKLHEAGFTILMDDFGSEYSSLNTLKSIEVDVLKIDMKFLQTGEDTKKGEIILASVIRMAIWLGMSVVVEGVETRRQRDFLEGVSCECVQGYYYSKPIPNEEYKEKYVIKMKHTAPIEQDDLMESPKHNVTILVIDDDEIDRSLLSEYFKEDYHVHQCESAEEGLSYLKQNHRKVRLILIDNLMSGLSGLDFIHYCQAEKELRDIPKIMITASDNVEDQVKAFQAGAYDYITKPLVPEVVVARVNHVMNINNQMRSFEDAKEYLQNQVEVDKATGLLNKMAFRELSRNILERNLNGYKALMVVDIDDFKTVNDKYGHLVGDEVILMVARTLSCAFRKTDIIGRFGGDEFCVMVYDLPSKEIAKRKAEEVIKSIMSAGTKDFHISLSVSIGIAFCELTDTIDTAFARADQALYDSKNSGKGKALVYGEVVPPIMDDNKPIVLICGDDPQLYPTIALAYGEEFAFSHITSFQMLKDSFESYGNRIKIICLDLQKKVSHDAEDFYQYILNHGGGEKIPMIAVCKEGNMEQLKEALDLYVQDVITLPPQRDVIQRRLSRAMASIDTKD